MQYDRLTTGLAVVLGALTVVLVVVALVSNLAVLFVAAAFGAATYFVYYHASGRMADRLYRRVEQQARVDGGRRRGGRRQTGAGPREEWVPPRDGQRAREAAGGGARGARQARQRQQQRQRQGRRQRGGRAPTASDGISAGEAYQRLGLDPSADQSTVKSAYREKVKEVHPDTDGGDEQAFKEIKEAYERLSD